MLQVMRPRRTRSRNWLAKTMAPSVLPFWICAVVELHCLFGRARGSAVEHPLHTRRVDGSIPSAPTNNFTDSGQFSFGIAGRFCLWALPEVGRNRGSRVAISRFSRDAAAGITAAPTTAIAARVHQHHRHRTCRDSRRTPKAATTGGILRGPRTAPRRSTGMDASVYEFAGGFPTPTTIQQAYHDADLVRAITAYKFFFPTVSIGATWDGNAHAGLVPNKQFLLMLGSPRQV